MTKRDYMNKSSKRGIFLSIILLFSILIITIPSNIYAEEVSVKSFAFEETTIIEITNDSNEQVNSFRIWLGSDFSFKSFKTEKGWVGEKTPQGVIIFTSSETIKPGESVKFGIKTDKVKPGINWKALDKGDNQISIGKVLPRELPDVVQNTKPKQDQIQVYDLSESIFRIVPEKPNVGSSIRVTGDKFAAYQEFDFYINSKKIGSFETDKDGHFMTTMKIPKDQKADRVDFKIIDKNGGEKKISLRIGEIDNRIPETQNIKLTIKGIPDVIHRGDFLEIFGTGDPGSAITAEIANSDGEIINSRTAEIDNKGDWKLDEPIIIALDTPFGKYSATITDGRQNILKHWIVESDKVIIITSSSLKFDPGEVMKFNGTALPNNPIELVLEDPLGKEIFSDIIQIDDSGFVEFEFPTTQSILEGTYTLIATQGKEKEFIFAGIGQLPSIPVNLEFDKLNYKAGDTAIISLIGKGSDIVSLLIIDPSDRQKGDTISITLQPDGRGSYSLNLDGYASGVYNAIVSKGNTKNTEMFAVGLQTGSGEIQITAVKDEYKPSESILILGNTKHGDVLVTLTLINEKGEKVKSKEIFAIKGDKGGQISDDSFRIPSNAVPGQWKIKAVSGSNFYDFMFEVIPDVVVTGMIVSFEGITNQPVIGDLFNFKVIGTQGSILLEIYNDSSELVAEIGPLVGSAGYIITPWAIPDDFEPGTYTLIANDAHNSSTTTFVYQ
ncbi:MAG: biofilm-associated protein [Nitrosopumilus sp.]